MYGTQVVLRPGSSTLTFFLTFPRKLPQRVRVGKKGRFKFEVEAKKREMWEKEIENNSLNVNGRAKKKPQFFSFLFTRGCRSSESFSIWFTQQRAECHSLTCSLCFFFPFLYVSFGFLLLSFQLKKKMAAMRIMQIPQTIIITWD